MIGEDRINQLVYGALIERYIPHYDDVYAAVKGAIRVAAEEASAASRKHYALDAQRLNEKICEWASIINSLACLALDEEISSNDRDYAQEMIEMVLPYLGGE
jgi:hypothetical protein